MPVGAGLAVAGVGAIVGGVVSAKANANATKAQMKSNSDALAYQKEQDQYLRSRYELEDQREQEARTGYQQYLASQGKGPAPSSVRTPNLIQGNGLAVTKSGTVAPPTLRDMAPAAPPSMPAAGPVAPPPALTPSDMAAAGSADVSTMPTIADVGRWNEWDPYLNKNRPQA